MIYSFNMKKVDSSLFESDGQKVISDYKVSSQNDYSDFISLLISSAKKMKFPKSSNEMFNKEIINRNQKIPLIEKTPWGMVSIKSVDVSRNFIKKLLVIKKFGVLGFEYHKKKIEKLKIFEGSIIVFYSGKARTSQEEIIVNVEIARAGDFYKFDPFTEHGILALTDCVIEEQSTNNLDDLFYIFISSQRHLKKSLS